MKINDKHLVAYGSSPECIDKEGFLKKRGELNKGFQRRWFVLKGNLLFYCEKRGDKPLGVIILEDCSVEVSDEDFYSFTISFWGGGTRVYTLSADSEDEMISWVKRIKAAPYGYAAMVVNELEKKLSMLKMHEEELLEKQAKETPKDHHNNPNSDLIDFEEGGLDLVERPETLIKEAETAVCQNSQEPNIKRNSNRNTIAIGSSPRSFNNLLTIVGAAAKMKSNIAPPIVRSKSSENIHKLASKSPRASPVPPRRKFNQSIMRRKVQHVKVEQPPDVTTSKTIETLSAVAKPHTKSTFYVLHNRYAAIVWTAIREFESGATEDLLKFE